ncbi:hybrid sensor histidine kinase/response regulator [Desulfamplus magnetovallimortis]|nr:hybrid sensor histidine kinase/response regulator [Desulfamplus magnetovallimortis]
MPEMDGLAVLGEVVKKSPETPVIIISGAANIGDTVDALRLGAWDYIIKPIQDMTVLIHSVTKCLERAQLLREKEQYRKGLEKVNAQLIQSLDALEKTKDKLVQAEKMAALGGLVAGVAHEINTPVGIAITAASFLKDRTGSINSLFTSGTLKKSDLENYLQNMGEVSHSILVNMERAAALIKSFKQVAVDQTIEEKRVFNLKKYLQDVLVSLRPAYRNRMGIVLEVNCPDTIEVNSYPGAFSQIISNLLMNSFIHGFKDEKSDKGEVFFDISFENSDLFIKYRDTGVGMNDEQLAKIFDPFFTTTRGQGGTGLGMSIVFNLVTQTLGGTIECKSVYGEETEFLISVPGVLVL